MPPSKLVMAIRPYIRTFDSNQYYTELAANEICLAIAWSSDYSVAQQLAREDGTGAHLAFTLPKEGSNITYNAFLIPASAPHPEAAHKFLNFILDPKVIAEITNDIHYGNDNLASRPFVDQRHLGRPGHLPLAGGAREIVLAGGIRPRLRPAANASLDAHQNGPVAASREAISRTKRPFCDLAQASLRPGNGNLRPHINERTAGTCGARCKFNKGDMTCSDTLTDGATTPCLPPRRC